MSNREKIAYDAICAYVNYVNKKANSNLALISCPISSRYRIASYGALNAECPCVMSKSYSYKTYAGLLKAMMKFRWPYFYCNKNMHMHDIAQINAFGNTAEEILLNLELKNVFDE